MEWLFLVMAGIGEIGFVLFTKLSNGFKVLPYTLLSFASGLFSLFFLSHALKTISLGTGYAIWTGIGAVGSVVMGMVLFDESREWKRLCFISMIIFSVIGLRLVS